MYVGDFSAQCLNGRRQAMIFRLRGVALFQVSFFRVAFWNPADQLEAYQPSGNGSSGHIPWLSLAAFGCCADVLAIGTGGVDASARRRRSHCKFIVVALTNRLEIQLTKSDVSSIN